MTSFHLKTRPRYSGVSEKPEVWKRCGVLTLFYFENPDVAFESGWTDTEIGYDDVNTF